MFNIVAGVRGSAGRRLGDGDTRRERNIWVDIWAGPGRVAQSEWRNGGLEIYTWAFDYLARGHWRAAARGCNLRGGDFGRDFGLRRDVEVDYRTVPLVLYCSP